MIRTLYVLLVLAALTNFALASTESTLKSLVWDEGQPSQQLGRLERASGLRVLWWNVENGIVNKTLSTRTLDLNLQNIIQTSIRPDVIVMAEFTERAVSEQTLKALQAEYQFSYFQKYNNSLSTEGIVVFSKFHFEVEFISYLDWTPLTLGSDGERVAYRNQWLQKVDFYTRPFFSIKIEKDNGFFNLLPIHLLDPWREIRIKEGIIQTSEEVLWGRNNPLWFQIQRLENFLHLRFGNDLSQAPFLLFGDFNTPKSFGIKTIGYKRLTQDLLDVVAGDPTTFPSKSSVENKTFPRVEIDHGFTNSRSLINAAEVLPLQGSDHYALYFILRN